MRTFIYAGNAQRLTDRFVAHFIMPDGFI